MMSLEACGHMYGFREIHYVDYKIILYSKYRIKYINVFFQQKPGEETELVEKLPQMWDDLVYKSKNTDAGLTVVKKKFTEVRYICYGNSCDNFDRCVQ